jgi:hypothetical protein
MESTRRLFRAGLSFIAFAAADRDVSTEICASSLGTTLTAVRFIGGLWKKDDTDDGPCS